MGVRPLEPGFGKIVIRPQPASLESASADIPTIRGTVSVSFDNKPKGPFTLKVEIPANMTARVGLPAGIIKTKTLTLDGKKVQAKLIDGYLFIANVGSGKHTLIRN
jgi:hypothetical protein